MSVARLELARTREALRQEALTFGQRQRQDARWFHVRVAMGWTAVALLPSLGAACVTVLLSPEHYSSTAVGWAACALFVDLLGLVIAIWKVILGPHAVTRLAPVTRATNAHRSESGRQRR